MQLDIVAHCINYSRLLIYQLSSLVLHPAPPEIKVRYILVFSPSDRGTQETWDFFSQIRAPNLEWVPMRLRPQLVFSRAVGRNRAARTTSADWVWFADCDYCLGAGVLSSLLKSLQGASKPLVFPRCVHVTNHADGDQLIEEAFPPAVRDLSRVQFHSTRQSRAIGGVQIVQGEVCRKMGYVPNERRFQRPYPSFTTTTEDVVFRRQLGTPGQPIRVDDVFRIRHSKKGYFGMSLEKE